MSQTFILPPITVRASPGSWSGNPIRLPGITVFGNLPKPLGPNYNKPVIPNVPNRPVTPPPFRPTPSSPLRPLPPIYHPPVIPVYHPPKIPVFKPPVFKPPAIPVFKPPKIPIFKPPPPVFRPPQTPIFKPPKFPNVHPVPMPAPLNPIPKRRDEGTDEKFKAEREKMKERMRQLAKKKQDEFFIKVSKEIRGIKNIIPPSIAQKGKDDCWAAAFASFLAAVGEEGHSRTQEELLEGFKASDKGFDFNGFRNYAAAFGMDSMFISQEDFTASKMDQLLKTHSVLFVSYLVEEGPYWWHDVVLFNVSRDSLGVGAYKVMNPSFKLVNHKPIPQGYQTWSQEQFFPKNDELLIGWIAGGKSGTIH